MSSFSLSLLGVLKVSVGYVPVSMLRACWGCGFAVKEWITASVTLLLMKVDRESSAMLFEYVKA